MTKRMCFDTTEAALVSDGNNCFTSCTLILLSLYLKNKLFLFLPLTFWYLPHQRQTVGHIILQNTHALFYARLIFGWIFPCLCSHNIHTSVFFNSLCPLILICNLIHVLAKNINTCVSERKTKMKAKYLMRLNGKENKKICGGTNRRHQGFHVELSRQLLLLLLYHSEHGRGIQSDVKM